MRLLRNKRIVWVVEEVRLSKGKRKRPKMLAKQVSPLFSSEMLAGRWMGSNFAPPGAFHRLKKIYLPSGLDTIYLNMLD